MGVGTAGTGTNGYWFGGSDVATTTVVGDAVPSEDQTNSCMPELLGSAWRAYERWREKVAMLPATTFSLPETPDRLASVFENVIAYTVPLDPVDIVLSPPAGMGKLKFGGYGSATLSPTWGTRTSRDPAVEIGLGTCT